MSKVVIPDIPVFATAIEQIMEENECSLADAIQAYFDTAPKNAAETQIDIVLNYGPKSHAIFGETFAHKDLIQGLNSGGKKLVSYARNLMHGPGYTIMDKTRLQEVTDMLDENEITYSTYENSEYVAREKKTFKKAETTPAKTVSKTVPKAKVPAKKAAPKTVEERDDDSDHEEENPAPKKTSKVSGKAVSKTVAKTSTKSSAQDPSKMTVDELKTALGEAGLTKAGKKADLAERLKNHLEGGSKAPAKSSKAAPKSKKAAPAPKSEKQTLKAKKNQWGNMEEEETGLIFMELPTGTNGEKQKLVVGVQDNESEEKGLDSVNPLDEDMIEECKTHKWRYLNWVAMNLLKKRDKKLYALLKKMMDRGGAEEGDDVEEEKEDEENEENEDAGDDVEEDEDEE